MGSTTSLSIRKLSSRYTGLMKKIKENDFIDYREYSSHYYGTSKSHLEAIRDKGKVLEGLTRFAWC